MRLNNFHLNLDMETGELRLYSQLGSYHVLKFGNTLHQFILRSMVDQLQEHIKAQTNVEESQN